MGTLPAAAIAMLTSDFVPDLALWQKRHVTQRPVFGSARPVAYLFELAAEIIEKASLPPQGKFEPAFAKVIASAFSQSSYEPLINTINQKRDVFIYKLFLERNSISADHRLLARTANILDSRNKVCKALAYTGARLNS